MDARNCGGSCRSTLYKKDVLDILRRQILMAGEGKVFYSTFVLNPEASMEKKLDFIL